jgi:signal transduction histidine kinase
MVSMPPELPDSQNTTKNAGAGANAGFVEPHREELVRALALAEKKLEIVGSVTRHDALNQLTVIMGYNELLTSIVQDKEQLNFLETERRSTEKMQRIFAYSKVYQAVGTESAKWQNFGMLIRFAHDEVDLGTVAIRSGVDACSVFAAPLFVKVLVYLFDNAVRHGKHTTGIQVRLRKTGQDAVLCIEDDGVGVEDGDKEKIFDKGFGKYTGWGLFVARDILAANGMTIRETGTAGAGACFEIHIPADRIRAGTGS